MRNNQPVTNVEHHLPENEFIYSRTDLKGLITEANEAFCAISGFSRDEMVGQPHNLVRHPDMPEEAFDDLWRDLKAGRPWRGIVKNRRKDGGYYWVIANASPVRENGQVVGYQSVRARPSREEIAAAYSAYQRVKAGDKSIRIEHGKVVKNRPEWLEALLSLKVQMWIMGLGMMLAGILAMVEKATGSSLAASLHEFAMVAGFLYAIYFVFFFAPSVNRDLELASEWMGKVLSTGNLTERLSISRRDLVGSLARRADTFVASVQATVQGMADMASQVNRATKEVNQGVTEVDQSARTQSQATASAAAAVEEVTVSIGEVADHAHSTQEVATRTGEVAKEGASLSERASNAILSLAETVKASASQVETLGQRSAEISRIAGVIKEIADQTNLLALNAAIEAARAGEQGRGFAVVADEVRKLAERTAKATEEISGMIASIQDETGKAVAGMRSGATQVEQGVELVHEAQQALQSINTQMGNTVQMVNDISHASAEQRQAMNQLAQNVEQVAAMTERNVAVVTQTESMVHYLDQVVDRMRKSVRQYTV
jgi:aerotaxis receptor